MAALAREKGNNCICIAGSVLNGYKPVYDIGVTAVFSAMNRPMNMDQAIQNAYALVQGLRGNVARAMGCKVGLSQSLFTKKKSCFTQLSSLCAISSRSPRCAASHSHRRRTTGQDQRPIAAVVVATTVVEELAISATAAAEQEQDKQTAVVRTEAIHRRIPPMEVFLGPFFGLALYYAALSKRDTSNEIFFFPLFLLSGF